MMNWFTMKDITALRFFNLTQAWFNPLGQGCFFQLLYISTISTLFGVLLAQPHALHMLLCFLLETVERQRNYY